MNLKQSLPSLLLLVLAGGLAGHALAEDENSGTQTITRADSQASIKGPDKWFTGAARIDPLFPANNTAHYSGAYVTFEPGARSAWHLHPAGQHIDLTLSLNQVADGYRAMDERKAIKALLRP